MSIASHHPPLLLTKRLTGFLHANATAQLPTLLITTPSGKLLAHASHEPVSLLRTHATVAASLQQIHTSSSTILPTALPGARTPEHYSSPPPGGARSGEDDDDDDEEDEEGTPGGEEGDLARKVEALKPTTITVQLTGGTVLIRRLKCGLLLVCVGPSSAAGSDDHTPTQQQQQTQQHIQQSSQQLLDTMDMTAAPVSTSPSEVESQLSTTGSTTTVSMEGSGAAAVVAMRKHASNVAKWLDAKLGTLTVPDEGVGVE
jgi:hypothetical protein